MKSRLFPGILCVLGLTGCPAPTPGPDGSSDGGSDTSINSDATPSDGNPGTDGTTPDTGTDPDAAVTDMCPAPGQAITLPTTTVNGTLSGTSGISGARCNSLGAGPEAVHTLTLTAPTSVLLSTAGMATNIETIISVRRTCSDGRTEVACADGNGPRPGAAVYRGDLLAGTYSVIVDQVGDIGSPPGGGMYNLLARQIDKAPNAECATATALTSGMTLMAETTARAVGNSRLCDTGDSGAQLYYSLSIPAGRVATVTVTPTGTPAWSARVRVLSGCAATFCSSSVKSTAAGAPVNVRVANSGTAAMTAIIAVSGTSLDQDVTFNIGATTMSAGYTVTNGTASCDTMTTATALPSSGTGGAWGDSTASAKTALGFTLQYFGAPATHFTASADGYGQMWPDGTGTTGSTGVNRALDAALTPPGIIAPLWDDLLPLSAAVNVKTATFGAAPNRHFTAQWDNFSFNPVPTPTPAPITFQIKWFETTNVIEFHYCSLPTGFRGNGNMSTIGLLAMDRSSFIPVGFDMPVINPPTLVRFVP